MDLSEKKKDYEMLKYPIVIRPEFTTVVFATKTKTGNKVTTLVIPSSSELKAIEAIQAICNEFINEFLIHEAEARGKTE